MAQKKPARPEGSKAADTSKYGWPLNDFGHPILPEPGKAIMYALMPDAAFVDYCGYVGAIPSTADDPALKDYERYDFSVRDPGMFFGVEEADAVVIDGDWPEICEAYEKAGVKILKPRPKAGA